MLSEARDAIDRKTDLFIESGAAQLDEIIAQRDRLESLKTESKSDFPLSGAEIADLRTDIRDQVLRARSRRSGGHGAQGSHRLSRTASR